LGDVEAVAIEGAAVFAALFGLGEGSNFDPVVERDFGFVAFGVGLELVGSDVDGDVIFAVGALTDLGVSGALKLVGHVALRQAQYMKISA